MAKKAESNEKKIGEYRPPEQLEDPEKAMAPKDKRMKVLYSRYEDVPNVESDDKMWEKAQNEKINNKYRTKDEIEEKRKQKYDVILSSSIKFVKTDMLNKAIKLKEIQEELK